MVSLNLEVENLTTDYSISKLTIPCNLHSKLDRDCEYVIVSCEPAIPMGGCDDIEKLNEILDTINNESPGMTNTLLRIMLEAADTDIFDEKFLERIVENNFMFEDLSAVQWKMDPEEIAACYLMTVLKIPFSQEITPDMIEVLSNDAVVDYISWSDMWDDYHTLGFRIVEDLESETYGLYLIHWKS